MFKSLAPTLSIIIAIVIVVFFTRPIFDETKSLNDKIAAYKETTSDYKDFLSKLDELEGTRRNIGNAKQVRLNTMLPQSIDLPQVLVNIEDLARKNGLLFGNISIVAEKQQTSRSTRVGAAAANVPTLVKGVEHKDVNFSVIGSYEQFKSFLQNVERSLNFMEITNISLTASGDRFQQYTVTVRVFSLPSESDNS